MKNIFMSGYVKTDKDQTFDAFIAESLGIFVKRRLFTPTHCIVHIDQEVDEAKWELKFTRRKYCQPNYIYLWQEIVT